MEVVLLILDATVMPLISRPCCAYFWILTSLHLTFLFENVFCSDTDCSDAKIQRTSFKQHHFTNMSATRDVIR